MPDAGATALVAASVGRARAMKMALLAEKLPAREAAAIGLIAEVCPDDEFTAAVDAVAARLGAGPAEAFHATKDAINDATLGQLDTAFGRERAGQLELLAGTEFAEGVAAFEAKREPVFTKA